MAKTQVLRNTLRPINPRIVHKPHLLGFFSRMFHGRARDKQSVRLGSDTESEGGVEPGEATSEDKGGQVSCSIFHQTPEIE